MNAVLIQAIAILEELVDNGDVSQEQLYAWYLGEEETIKQIIEEGNFIISCDPRNY
jgi:hypothetical protein